MKQKYVMNMELMDLCVHGPGVDEFDRETKEVAFEAMSDQDAIEQARQNAWKEMSDSVTVLSLIQASTGKRLFETPVIFPLNSTNIIPLND